MRTTCIGFIVTTLVVSLAIAAPGRAQSLAGAASRLKPGDTVYVLDASGRTTEGTFLEMSRASIKLSRPAPLEIRASEVYRVEKLGDPVWDGALKGGAILGAWCALVCGQGLDSRDSWFAVVAVNAGFGAAIGAVIDWAHKGRTAVYKREPGTSSVRSIVEPIVAPGRKALLVRIGF